MHATFRPTCNIGNMLDLYAMQNKHANMQQFEVRTNMLIKQTIGLNCKVEHI